MPRCSRGQVGANWVTLTSNLRFRFGRRSSVSTAPPRARVVVPTKIVPSLSPYGGPGRSLPSLPPCVQRLCRSDGHSSPWTAARPPIGCVGTSAEGRTAMRCSSLRYSWFRPRELRRAVWPSAAGCSVLPNQSAEPVTAAPGAVTHHPRPRLLSARPARPRPFPGGATGG